MQLSEFDYHLPEELIAQTPLEKRDHSRLLQLDKHTGAIKQSPFYDILDQLWENDVLVVNKTKVINARLHGFVIIMGHKKKQVEVFLHKQISDDTWDCLVYPGKNFKLGQNIDFYIDEKIVLTGTVQELTEQWRIITFSQAGTQFLETIEQLGEIPLPAYIKEKSDPKRYQTVYHENNPGSVAAPTAGLHFTQELLEKLQKKWVIIEKVLLHVGLGTFMWVRTENILEHSMHSEYIELEEDVAHRLNQYKAQNKRIIAVGTTSIRVMESFSDDAGILSHGSKETDIFIYPGYKWKFIDAMITNFHLPKSTLLMLVSSFWGKESVDAAYDYAIKNNFRFFSFGDAMFIK